MYNMYLEHLVFNPNSERVECENVFKMPFTRSRFLFDRSIYDKRKERFQLKKKRKTKIGFHHLWRLTTDNNRLRSTILFVVEQVSRIVFNP